MSSACKLGVEELVEALTACLLADESAGEDDDVGIVVLADEVGYLGGPYTSPAPSLSGSLRAAVPFTTARASGGSTVRTTALLKPSLHRF